ncbi:hypothetical protein ACJX0J_010259 [Zea mays]
MPFLQSMIWMVAISGVSQLSFTSSCILVRRTRYQDMYLQALEILLRVGLSGMVSFIRSDFFPGCSTILHTPLTTSLFLGLNQLDYTLNVFCSTILHTPLTTSLFLGLNQLDYTLNVFYKLYISTR